MDEVYIYKPNQTQTLLVALAGEIVKRIITLDCTSDSL